MDQAALKVSSIFGDHMVLQRGIELPVWGTGPSGKRVSIALAGKSASAQVDAEGKWHARLPAIEAGGPQEMTVRIEGPDTQEVRFTDVLLGEVWVASGQSNMEWPVNLSINAQAEIDSANFPQIRLYTVPKVAAPEMELEANGSWSVCSPETVSTFSAVAYFFGREVNQSLKIPIGLINTSWGGTPAESWTSREAMRAVPSLEPMVHRAELSATDLPARRREYVKQYAEWEKAAFHQDPGNKGEGLGWAKPDHDARDWRTMKLPIFWNAVGMRMNGAVWFRREVQAPANWVGKDLSLELGPIDDFDTTYFNGTRVGSTGKDTPNFWAAPRVYTVPGSLVKPGRNVIAVRVFDWANVGGFGGPAELMKLGPSGAASGDSSGAAIAGDAGGAISLAGEWLFKVELELELKNAMTQPPMPPEPMSPANPGYPGSLYNGMIHPLIPFGIRGAIWYQGESNADRADQYRTLFQTMIRDWRTRWKQGEFPFLFVQLANYLQRQPVPAESSWAELREAQTMALKLPNTGMAVAFDVGDALDIHPINKQDVGKRLAYAAEATVYGKKRVYSGPLYESMQVRGDSVRLRFRHTGSGLLAKGGGALKGFSVAGEDRRFTWADASIEGDEVVVRSPQVKSPVAVRYGWAENPEVNLYNREGLPASPFRTDDWPGLTTGRG